MRIDKWLWAARFFKTRQLAVKAIKTGKISINAQSVSKPATQIKVADLVSVKRGLHVLQIEINSLSEQRDSATVAQALYSETQQSIKARKDLQEQLAGQPKILFDRRKPHKRNLRTQRALKRNDPT